MQITSEPSNYQIHYQQGLSDALFTLFPSIEADLLEEVSGKMDWRKLRAGEVLFHQGDEGNSMYILLSGRMQAIVHAGDISEQVVGEIAKGESAGEMSLITGEKRTATVRAVRDSILARLSKEDFEDVITRHPQMVMGISKQIIQRLTTSIHKITRKNKFTGITIVPVGNKVDVKGFVEDLHNGLRSHSKTLYLNEQNTREALHHEDDVSFINWLAQQELENDVIIYATDGKETEWTRRSIRQADKVILLVNAGEDEAILAQRLQVLQEEYAVPGCELAILYPSDTQNPTDTHKLLQSKMIRCHYNLRQGNVRDIQRLGRLLTGKANALVLSGGGARGLAHIGIYRALYEANIPIDLVAGTSIGSIVAAAIAMDWHPDIVQSEARKAFLVDKPLKDYTLPIFSLIKGKQMQAVNNKYFKGINIEDLWINYFCVSSNFSTSELKVHQRGPLFRAITASASIPGVLPPVVDGDHLLVDGGVMNNFPVDIMKEMHNCKIIGVDLSSEKEYRLNYDRIPGGWYYLWNKILPFGKRYKVPGIATIMMKSTLLGSFQKQLQVKQDVDLYFNPPVGKYKLLDMKAFDALVKVGYDHAKETLKGQEIKEKVWQE